MPDLSQSLLKQDIGHLRIIAELWGLELKSTDADMAREELVVSLIDPDLLAEIIDSLSPEANSAIDALINTGGRIPWPTFTRKYGEIREAGAGKRDREKLYLNPTSTTETLYYRALLARAFFDTQKGPQEFAYIPDELFSLLSIEEDEAQEEPAEEKPEQAEPIGRAASPGEKGQDIPGGSAAGHRNTGNQNPSKNSSRFASIGEPDQRIDAAARACQVISGILARRCADHATNRMVGKRLIQ
jgi:hypothetical protein